MATTGGMGMLTTATFIRRVLANNDFGNIVRCFVSSGDERMFIDRHVFDAAPDDPITEELVAATCSAAMALAREWQRSAREQEYDGLFVSRPYVVIDDDWLSLKPMSAPPHVCITLARNKESLPQRDCEPSQRREKSGHPSIDSSVTPREKLYRIDPPDESDPGWWIVDLQE